MFVLTDEQRMLVDNVGRIARTHFLPKAQKWDDECVPPVENLTVLAEQGFLGICVPTEYGGLGASNVDLVLMVEKISESCPNTAILSGSFDGATPRSLVALGTEDQKRRYLPKFVTGELLPVWGMSEPNAGSDVGALSTRAVKKGDRYILNGSKIWCSGAQLAGLALVFARMSDAPGLKGVGALLVETASPGFSVGNHLDLMGLRGTGMAELFFDDVDVPEENLLVRPGQMKDLLSVFNGDRVTTNPPICLGAAQAAFDAAVRYMSERTQFGRKLSEFQGLQWRVADMAIELAAARNLLYQTAAAFDRGEGTSLASSIVKTYLNEVSVRVTNTAVQMMGTMGLTREAVPQRMYRDVRGMSFGYGTTEIQRNMIAKEIFGALQ